MGHPIDNKNVACCETQQHNTAKRIRFAELGENKQAGQGNVYYNVDSFINSQIQDQLNGQVKLECSEPEYSIVKDRMDSGGFELKLYPNPANQEVTVEYECNSEGTFELYNAQGQLLYKTLLPKGNSSTKITLSKLANGVYNYKCEFDACKSNYGLLTILK